MKAQCARYARSGGVCTRATSFLRAGRPLGAGGRLAYSYEELKAKTIADLREIAKTVEQHDAVQGYSQMNKEHLLPALCKALGVEMHGHHEAVGIDKPALKARMRAD